MPNEKISLAAAQTARKDEFYTQYADIEKEVNVYLEYNPDVFRDKTVLLPCDDPEWSNFTRYFAQHFESLGLRKLISTSYAADSKEACIPYQLTLWEQDSPKFDPNKTKAKGKIFVLERDRTGDGRINIEDLDFEYLEGDGDFRSEEVRKLRDEADIIVTNPPFSLFREFLEWIMAAQKKFLIIGNLNAITYKEVFPLIKENKLWLGVTWDGRNHYFGVPDNYPLTQKTGKIVDGKKYAFVKGVMWYTNIEHGRRHQHLPLMTREQNIRYNKKLNGQDYAKYLNCDAIEVPFVDAIPCDYDGLMGVPISFLNKFCPEQFEIVKFRKGDDGKDLKVAGKSIYFRILIRKKQ